MTSALIVEIDGHVAGANTYVLVADVTTYVVARGNDTWSILTTAQKEAAILDAARYIDYVYRYQGERINSQQAMAWPRYLYLDDDMRTVPTTSVPQRVKDAQCLLALESTLADYNLLKLKERGNLIRDVKVGPLEVRYEHAASGDTEYPAVDALLADLIRGKIGRGVFRTAVR